MFAYHVNEAFAIKFRTFIREMNSFQACLLQNIHRLLILIC